MGVPGGRVVSEYVDHAGGAKRREAEAALRAWARSHDRRNDVIRAAIAAGASVSRVHQLTGIARTTIVRVLAADVQR